MNSGMLQHFFREKLTPYYDEREIRNIFFQVLEHFFHIDRIHFFTEKDREFSNNDLKKIKKLIRELTDHKPLQYILGESCFYKLRFFVNPAVLIPRPETEELVDLILQRMPSVDENHCRILDVGTGSGCIAISLSVNTRNSQCWACDISEEALGVARQNALFNNADITFFHLDILQQEIPTSVDNLDIVISNPPYVRESEKPLMKPNVLLFEPMTALMVKDDDPLVFYRNISDKAYKHLRKGGKIFFEINEEFGDEMVLLLESMNFKDVMLWNDIHGKDRFIEGTR